ncbi:MarR family winged helix-turn-helix transcriptional regulator [Acidiluteibacter ferrifornacis]|uniref:MarR family transcriptional regulator n=1 Tax=Acidiluteibacter ferrifornacis TaxID=2692424 RepID=A0A6N9NJK1_9FLAO|nr:MarR family transcriptional regulator [Acidiluteibacter ferrifornacis]NBG66042.1 MarR family transcriptional regulator [Acidiluteibacter ferrifornacis]
MKPNETVDYHIKVNWHALTNLYNGIAAEHGLTQATGFVLLNIEDYTGTPATKIAPLMGMKATSLSRILKNMENSGLIERKGDKSDGRMVRIHLTEEGVRKKQIAKQVVKDLNEYIIKNIPQKKLETYFEVMGNINDLIANYKETK